MHAAEFNNDGVGDEEERKKCGSSEGREAVALMVRSAEMRYLPVQEK